MLILSVHRKCPKSVSEINIFHRYGHTRS